MSLVYEWTITKVKTRTDLQNRTNSICGVDWLVQGWDINGDEGYYEGACTLSSDESENFISFNNLTEENVLSWVQSAISDDQRDIIEKTILDTIEYKKRPVQYKDSLPWE